MGIKPITKVTAVFDRAIELLAFLARIIVLMMMLGITSEVVTRYFLNSPIIGVIEITETMILWIVFLGAAWLLREGEHVRMEVVVTRFKPVAQAWLSIITYFIGAVICLVLVWYGTEVTWNVLREGIRQAGLIRIPTGVVTIIIPIGSLLLFIQYLRSAYGFWRKLKSPVTE